MMPHSRLLWAPNSNKQTYLQTFQKASWLLFPVLPTSQMSDSLIPTKMHVPLESARSYTCACLNVAHPYKRCLPLGRKAVTNLDSILKNRDITLPTKVCLVKAMVFPVVMYGCESWIIKKAEHWIIDAFELWCWGRQQGDQISQS